MLSMGMASCGLHLVAMVVLSVLNGYTWPIVLLFPYQIHLGIYRVCFAFCLLVSMYSPRDVSHPPVIAHRPLPELQDDDPTPAPPTAHGWSDIGTHR